MNNNDNKIFDITSYVEWLNEYTKNHSQFDTYEVEFSEVKSSKDYSNIKLLSQFFFSIDEYAKNNLIYSNRIDYEEYYFINIYGTIYIVGYNVGQGTIFYISKSKIQDLSNVINIDDVIQNKKRPGVDNMKDKLGNLRDTIISLYEDGLPIESIKTYVNMAYEEISKKESENYQKTRRK